MSIHPGATKRFTLPLTQLGSHAPRMRPSCTLMQHLPGGESLLPLFIRFGTFPQACRDEKRLPRRSPNAVQRGPP